jgi:tetratricopeptide (TPR) repeat protein
MSINNPPRDRRKFTGAWDEIEYGYQKLLYWLYQREDVRRARPYAKRLESLLPRVDPGHDAILGEGCWSLIYETKGDLSKAIEHRENEIRLIRRLHEISRRSPHKEFVLKDYGLEDLSDRLDLLATLYHDAGHLEKAISILRKSKAIGASHGFKFDGHDLLREYLEEKGKPAGCADSRRRRAV